MARLGGSVSEEIPTSICNWDSVVCSKYEEHFCVWANVFALSSHPHSNNFSSRGVVKFWKFVAHPGQWLNNLGGLDQILWTALSIIILQMALKEKTVSYLISVVLQKKKIDL